MVMIGENNLSSISPSRTCTKSSTTSIQSLPCCTFTEAPHRILYTMPVDTARYAVDSVRGLLHDRQDRCSTEDAKVVSIIGVPNRHLQLLCVREALVSERESM